MATVAQRIIDGERVSADEIRASDETSVKNALMVMNDSIISPDYLGDEARQVYEKIKTRGDLVEEIH
jgi:hypothetical protein